MPASLIAVVELQQSVQEFWLPLPQAPWPEFLKLGGDCTDDELALVMLELTRYNQRHGTPLRSPAELAQVEVLALPGGIAVIDGCNEIMPSCCSGVECWGEWQYFLDGGNPPWMGHDPTPTVLMEQDGYVVWPDENLSPAKDALSIRFTRTELTEAIKSVEQSLFAFADRLEAFLPGRLHDDGRALMDRIRECFDLPRSGQQNE